MSRRSTFTVSSGEDDHLADNQGIALLAKPYDELNQEFCHYKINQLGEKTAQADENAKKLLEITGEMSILSGRFHKYKKLYEASEKRLKEQEQVIKMRDQRIKELERVLQSINDSSSQMLNPKMANTPKYIALAHGTSRKSRTGINDNVHESSGVASSGSSAVSLTDCGFPSTSDSTDEDYNNVKKKVSGKRTCEICGFLVSSSHYGRHLDTHSETKRFVCQVCKRAYTRKKNLDDHRCPRFPLPDDILERVNTRKVGKFRCCAKSSGPKSARPSHVASSPMGAKSSALGVAGKSAVKSSLAGGGKSQAKSAVGLKATSKAKSKV